MLGGNFFSSARFYYSVVDCITNYIPISHVNSIKYNVVFICIHCTLTRSPLTISFQADLNTLDFKTLFVSLRFEMRTLRNAGRFVQWMWCIITWAIKRGGTFYHVIFRHLGYFALRSIKTLQCGSSCGT